MLAQEGQGGNSGVGAAAPVVVVMLTQTHEAGREKCFPYFPLSAEESPLQILPEEEEGEGGWRGEVRLEGVAEDAGSRSQLRKLRLRWWRGGEEAEELEIRHLLFSGWPDFLIPEGEDRAALVELVRLSASLNRPPASSSSVADEDNTQPNGTEPLPSSDEDSSPSPFSTSPTNPRIIHCSAGVGRSGTFIALDYLLSLLHSNQLDDLEEDKDPIVETVDQLRQQRMMMVQGEGQFAFLYEVLRECMVERMRQRGEEREAEAGAGVGDV